MSNSTPSICLLLPNYNHFYLIVVSFFLFSLALSSIFWKLGKRFPNSRLFSPKYWHNKPWVFFISSILFLLYAFSPFLNVSNYHQITTRYSSVISNKGTKLSFRAPWFPISLKQFDAVVVDDTYQLINWKRLYYRALESEKTPFLIAVGNSGKPINTDRPVYPYDINRLTTYKKKFLMLPNVMVIGEYDAFVNSFVHYNDYPDGNLYEAVNYVLFPKHHLNNGSDYAALYFAEWISKVKRYHEKKEPNNWISNTVLKVSDQKYLSPDRLHPLLTASNYGNLQDVVEVYGIDPGKISEIHQKYSQIFTGIIDEYRKIKPEYQISKKPNIVASLFDIARYVEVKDKNTTLRLEQSGLWHDYRKGIVEMYSYLQSISTKPELLYIPHQDKPFLCVNKDKMYNELSDLRPSKNQSN